MLQFFTVVVPKLFNLAKSLLPFVSIAQTVADTNPDLADKMGGVHKVAKAAQYITPLIDAADTIYTGSGRGAEKLLAVKTAIEAEHATYVQQTGDSTTKFDEYWPLMADLITHIVADKKASEAAQANAAPANPAPVADTAQPLV